jgi:hypothetical protein
MRTIDITTENFEEYRDSLPEEHLDDIGRQYCRALVGIDPVTGKADASMFWEIKNVEKKIQISLLKFIAIKLVTRTTDRNCWIPLMSFAIMTR